LPNLRSAGTCEVVATGATFLATTEAEWRRVLDVSLWGVIHGCRAFGSRMVAAGSPGQIVDVASAAGYLPAKDLTAYATSKAAVICCPTACGGAGRHRHRRHGYLPGLRKHEHHPHHHLDDDRGRSAERHFRYRGRCGAGRRDWRLA
jgi:NAD(P)-dependent dehydrogenase (short-subunit alcohol dehydrogenase family)